MFEFHKDKKRYFDIQYKVTKDYIIPFLKDSINLKKPIRVLEIGCAEAGVLKAFVDLNHKATGIELSEKRIELASHFMAQELKEKKVEFIAKDIYEIDPNTDLPSKYDLVILKDVIEHIHNQEKFMAVLKRFLNKNGKVFFAFPPWQMPYGGHQQICKNELLSKLPYFHLLPRPLYKLVLKIFKEKPNRIEELLEIKSTGIRIERFEKIVASSGYKIFKQKHFIFNPIYEFKFGVKTLEQFAFVKAIPFFRNFFTMGVYYTIGVKE